MKFVKKQGEYMKFTKLSLVAALLAGSAAFAIDNVKVSGDAKLFYGTTDSTDKVAGVDVPQNQDLFHQDSSIGQAELGLGATADLASNISAGVHATVLTTLGLENSLVSGVWAGNITPGGVTTGNTLQASNGTAWWVDNAWIAASMGKTTAKVGRMDIDTPLAFTETWNIAKNTFEAAVLINQDIPGTTLVAAYVGGSNGANGTTVRNAQDGTTPFRGYTTMNDGAAYVGAVLGTNALDEVGGAGAYAVGVVNNSFKPLTVQGWYYNVTQVADAYWLQADLACQKIPGLLAGAQYTSMKLKNTVTSTVDGTSHNVKAAADANLLKLETTAYSVMLGFEAKDVATVKAAYSSVSDDGILTIQNTATGDASKLYTEAWWNYGVVGQSGADSYMVNVEAAVAGVDVLAQYTHADVKHKNWGSKAKMDEFTVTASKSYGPLDATLAYIYTDAKSGDTANYITALTTVANEEVKSHTIQAYLTLNF
jgi:imipenem/basic amino acid-specific outer membrane pore